HGDQPGGGAPDLRVRAADLDARWHGRAGDPAADDRDHEADRRSGRAGGRGAGVRPAHRAGGSDRAAVGPGIAEERAMGTDLAAAPNVTEIPVVDFAGFSDDDPARRAATA